MKRILFILLFFCSCIPVIAQPTIREKKYPSLLWEITGNNMRKPSYLIGTMHVSSKIAFNLPDSFYIAVKSAQVVALETNPETWQEDMNKYDLTADYSAIYSNYLSSMPSEYFNINILKFFRYTSKIERALYSNPSTINNLLYRSYGNESSDFEEDTYLDMYIYQCGKKWGKRVAGVEDYGESMKLMVEAYRDAAKDKNRKLRGYGGDEDYSMEKLQEAYRMGNLDVLDSINRYNSVSAAFDEKFLYERNRIQAANIDSILRSGTSLFVGVGAAHLPGDRGVIEMLREKGYRLRPVKMGERSSKQKEIVDKIRVPVVFSAHTSADGFYKVDIPGKLYRQGDEGTQDQYQYADMANGSYYMVTRVMTNAWMWDHQPGKVYQAVDSLLYENVPGKIISKTSITRNGYKGLDIVSRTRRGDIQRYNIFITPFEILFFKMSGNGEYVTTGEEAKRFFGSIQLKEFNTLQGGWRKYVPPVGGFSIDLPHEPFNGNDGSWIYDAADRTSGTHYRVVRTDIHHYGFAGEDSFDLHMMEESFAASEFIDSTVNRKLMRFQGYPALETKFRGKNGRFFHARFIIQGAHYYSLITDADGTLRNRFFDSFAVIPFLYKPARTETDTLLYYKVKTPVYDDAAKFSLGIKPGDLVDLGDDEAQTEEELLESGLFRSRIVENDSTGEKIYISFYRFPRYYQARDSALIERRTYLNDSNWIVRSRKSNTGPGGQRITESMLSDTGSSRALYSKSFYRNGVSVTLLTLLDTLSAPGTFIRTFYDTFTPSDSLKGTDPFASKSALFFDDFNSSDSVRHKRAKRNIAILEPDSADTRPLIAAVEKLNWDNRDYLDTKIALINKFGGIKTRESSKYLQDLYYRLDDTIQLQYPVLENLLQQKTAYSYNLFRDIINTEPPVLASTGSDYDDGFRKPGKKTEVVAEYQDGIFLDELFDSLQLTKSILPDLLPLINLDDYEEMIMSLLEVMADSNLLKTADYEKYYDKFLIEARQELRKQSIAEKRKAILKAEKGKTTDVSVFPGLVSDREEDDDGNDDLSVYAVLLQPFWDSKHAVRTILNQMLSSGDNKLKYTTLMLMIRNNRPYPDSLLAYFAGMDLYRYELYGDLRRMGKSALFPRRFNEHVAIAKSQLYNLQSYSRPDSISYIDRLKTTINGREGYVYFFRYRENKDDAAWKLATARLIPLDESNYYFEDFRESTGSASQQYLNRENAFRYALSAFTQTRIKESEPLLPQLEKELKKIVFASKKSGRGFFQDNTDVLSSLDFSY